MVDARARRFVRSEQDIKTKRGTNLKMKVFLTVILGILTLTSSSWAVPLKVNDQIILTYGSAHSGNGGEFAVYLGSIAPANKQFETFCLEANEYFNPGGTYKIAGISDYASYGGTGFDSLDGKSDAQHDYLSLQTRWLYYNFTKDFAGAGVSYFNNNDDAGLLQNAIWHFENEISLTDPSGNKFVIAANAAINTGNYNWSVLQQVKALNLIDSQGIRKQDQLYLATPEPVSMLLFGTGLFGIGGYLRRKFKK